MNEHDATEIAYKNGYKKGVEEKQGEIDALINAVDNSTKEFLKLHDAYQNQKTEIAREIFEEIDRFCMENKIEDVTDEQLYSWYKNLKKKYTEGET